MMTSDLGHLTQLTSLAKRYTESWGSQHAARVAAFYSPTGSLKINDGPPAVGRDAIRGAVQGFMTAFPDLKVLMDALESGGGRTIYRWTLVGTNSGPGGTGRRVRISGHEEWTIGSDGLITESLGHFDAEEYQRQLEA
jgi:hypothetical protein